MGDQGEWWRGISDMIKERGGIPFSELDSQKMVVINGLKLAIAGDEWAEASRLAKNAVIYNKLIELNRDIMEDDVIRTAESISPTLDAEFDPLVDTKNAEGIKLAIQKYIPAFGGGKSHKHKSRKRKSRKRNSRKRKSRKRKSRGHKSKRRNR